jgi:hypothetical protein
MTGGSLLEAVVLHENDGDQEDDQKVLFIFVQHMSVHDHPHQPETLV